MQVADFDYQLPDELIAQQPSETRGASRLMVLDRSTGEIARGHVDDLPGWLRPGDLLVVNNTRVFPARLIGRRLPGGGEVECLLLGRIDANRWDALVHPGHKVRVGRRFVCEGAGGRLDGEVLEEHTFGRRTIGLWAAGDAGVDAVIDAIGHVPLPPYINRPDTTGDRERYQTVFARERGSVAAPTAGLHFTPALLDALAARGVERTDITLHVGYGTFKPVRAERVEDHQVDAERYEIPASAAMAVNRALDEGRRVVAVGTTTTRALETAAAAGHGRLVAGHGVSEMFIRPGYEFRVLGALFTNFHVPRSSLLMLVSAFAGRERVLRAYEDAIAHRFRFYSYGDAMLIV
jgi:S-adenosylmethionine:tRNA ribosyltransferase-isomerase